MFKPKCVRVFLEVDAVSSGSSSESHQSEYMSPSELEEVVDFTPERAKLCAILIPLYRAVIEEVLISTTLLEREIGVSEGQFQDVYVKGPTQYSESLEHRKSIAFQIFAKKSEGQRFMQEATNLAFQEIIQGYEKVGWKVELIFGSGSTNCPPKAMAFTRK